jgi:uncharacterized LabA/DUF88 family protein
MDGGYVRELSKGHPGALPNPQSLAKGLVESTQVQTWAYDPTRHPNAFLSRITYYDALPNEGATVEAARRIEEYWRTIERLNDVHLGFGELRGLKRRVRQKGVDTLIAVDMVAGAYSQLFDIAVLVAGDADFVPVVEEVKRRGVMVAIAGRSSSTSSELMAAADRYIEIQPQAQWLVAMRDTAGLTWQVE